MFELFHNKKYVPEKNRSPQNVHTQQKKASLGKSVRKCVTDFKQSFSNTFLEISVAMY